MVTNTLLLSALLVASCSSVPSAYRPGTWELLNVELKELHRTGQYDQAEVVAKKSLQIAEDLFSSASYIAESQDNLALLYKTRSQYGKAESLFIRSLKIRERTFGPYHPSVGLSLTNLASLYQLQGLYERAEPLFKRAVLIQTNALDPNYSAWVESLEMLGELYRLTNRLEQAAISEKDLIAVNTEASTKMKDEATASATAIMEQADLSLPLEVLVRVDPEQSYDLQERGIKRKVIAEGRITNEGTVREPVIIESSDPALEKVVIEAILKYRFKPPMTKAGKPVSTRYRQPFNFGLADIDERVSQYALPKKNRSSPG
jgi:tetratricopeptide (TPR) repeat protein